MLLPEAEEEINQPTILTEDVMLQSHPISDVDIEGELRNLIFKLRSYQDPESGDYAAGTEAGMNRAAEMLQNLINRLRGE